MAYSALYAYFPNISSQFLFSINCLSATLETFLKKGKYEVQERRSNHYIFVVAIVKVSINKSEPIGRFPCPQNPPFNQGQEG